MVASTPVRKDFTLTDEQIEELTKAIKRDNSSRVVRRATAVHLLHQGHRLADVAETVSASKPIIYAWHQRFLAVSQDWPTRKRREAGVR